VVKRAPVSISLIDRPTKISWPALLPIPSPGLVLHERMSTFPSLRSVTRSWLFSTNLRSTPRSALPIRRFSQAGVPLQASSVPTTMASSSSDDPVPATATSNPVTGDVPFKAGVTEETPLPKLTPMEFRQFNRMADHVRVFHHV
jgi:hypothetical protein